jgi:RNA polymerase sigma factor (sigma-70 family)
MTARPFEEIVVEHGPVVMRVCRALLGPVDAEDAWSETFLAALRAYPQLTDGSNVKGWLVTIAHNKAVDVMRGASRRPTPAGDLPERTAAEAWVDPDDDLRAALDQLAPKQRAAVVYRYLADLPYAEIAALLECSQAAARRSTADALANLRTHYRQGTP